MRFHLTMFFVTLAVSMGMHAMASAAEADVADAGLRACHAAVPAVAAPAEH
jgi:hypothetical protein